MSGTLRGRKLLSLPRSATDVRPSSARVRSAIFDRLQHEVVGARVLDLFAGSGALAIEAISRGAAHAVLVEQQRELARFLAAQLDALSLRDRCDLVHDDALRYLRRPAAVPGFDLVLVDPPYAALDLYADVLALLIEQAWLAPEGVIVVEYEKHRGARPAIRVPERLHCEAVREHGQTALEFLRLRDPS
ncbi:16S rRNA (guanine(966)-N(2))-methyltransferase RsmD [Nannocystaceae bacterium ST9]